MTEHRPNCAITLNNNLDLSECTFITPACTCGAEPTPPAPTADAIREAREARERLDELVSRECALHDQPRADLRTLLAALDKAQEDVVETRAMLKRIMDASRDKCWTCAYEENLRGLTKRCLGCDVETACKWRPFWIGI